MVYMKKWTLYQWSVILFFLIVPVVATILEVLFYYSGTSVVTVLFKWFVFSGIGLRLGCVSIKQIFQPGFTAKEIFNISDEKAFIIVQELGCANLCLALLALLSICFGSFRIPAAISGGLFFGLAGIQHLLKSKYSNIERFAMVSDFYIFSVLSLLVILNYSM